MICTPHFIEFIDLDPQCEVDISANISANIKADPLKYSQN
jgi:hypothetical protein